MQLTMQHHQEQRNRAGLTAEEQALMNTAGCMLLREMLAKDRSRLDRDWLAISQPKRIAICALAHLPRGELMRATLSALPYEKRDAIRHAVEVLEFQDLFHAGCDRTLWHPKVKPAPVRDVEQEKKERASRLRLNRAVQLASQLSQGGPQPIGNKKPA